jgi:hypothetical protein
VRVVPPVRHLLRAKNLADAVSTDARLPMSKTRSGTTAVMLAEPKVASATLV